AFHDSCYTGRYNDIYREPRNILESCNIKIREPRRNRKNGFCCGAGGGRLFMEEKAGKRINIERTEELIDTNVSTIATVCPFCMTMITDGIKDKGMQERVEIKDISEILNEFL
ncbi:MAG: (Fe-S)-binding protein, partial [Ignavibacteria bacterium]|nr:(Fe-S)-binding protein [Ignavibacteria bacterium]